jgi:hypothetical protein
VFHGVSLDDANLAAASIKRNATESILLRLPTEIRRRIWAFTLGDRLLHISRQFREYHVFGCASKWVATCCQCPYIEKQLFERSKNSIDELVELDDEIHGLCEAGSLVRRWSEACALDDRKAERKSILERNPHSRCRPAYHNPWSIFNIDTTEIDAELENGDGDPCDGMPIHILQTCRQIYTEANPIFWATNTFSFQEPGEYRDFMEDRTSAQRATITKLHLDMDWTGPTMGFAWETYGGSLRMIRSFRNLKTISIHIEHGFPSAKRILPLYWDGGLEALRRYRVLPLDSVYVVVMNAKHTSDDRGSHRETLMTHQERVSLAEEIRQPILDSDGEKKLEEAIIAKQKSKLYRKWSTEEECAKFRELTFTRKVHKSGWSCGATHVCLVCGASVGYDQAKLCQRPGKCAEPETSGSSSGSAPASTATDIIIKPLNGGVVSIVQLSPTTTVLEMTAMYQEKAPMPAGTVCTFVFGKNVLKLGVSVLGYGMKKGNVVYVRSEPPLR